MLEHLNKKLLVCRNDANVESVFCWTDWHKGHVKGAFYYGYMLLQIPGGRLTEVRMTTKLRYCSKQ